MPKNKKEELEAQAPEELDDDSEELDDEDEGEEVDLDDVLAELFERLDNTELKVDSIERGLNSALNGIATMFEDLLFATADLPPGADESDVASRKEQQQMARKRVHDVIANIKTFVAQRK